MTMGVLLGLVGTAVLVIMVLLIIVVSRDDGGDVVADDTSTTEPTSSSTDTTEPGATTTEPATTDSTEPSTEPTEPSTTSTEPSTSTSDVDPAVYDTAVWPWQSSNARYDDPVDVARAFAENFVGFTDPIVGDFAQGDSRSGEVEVKARANGVATTVFVRQLGPNDFWWVLGSATENIVVDTPDALDIIGSPVTVAGEARAFEGTIQIQIRVDDTAPPVAEAVATASGDDTLGPFSAEIEWPDPGEGAGAIVLLTIDARDGNVWEAAVIRVGFGT